MNHGNMRNALLVGLFSFVVGCGGSSVDPNRPKTVPAGGVVTYKGQPVEGATVLLMASQGGTGRGAVGKSDSDGKFVLTTFDAADGAIPGSYRVTISKTITPDAPETPRSGGSADQEPPAPPAKEELPVKYKDPVKSGLTAEIAESGENNLQFDLVD